MVPCTECLNTFNEAQNQKSAEMVKHLLSEIVQGSHVNMWNLLNIYSGFLSICAKHIGYYILC